MAKPHYKKLTQKITGWSDKEYKRVYDVFRHRVKRFNLVSGTSYSPAQLLHAQQKYPKNKRVEDILKISSATVTTRERKFYEKEITEKELTQKELSQVEKSKDIVVDTLFARYSGMIARSRICQDFIDNQWTGDPVELDRFLRKYAEELHLKQEHGDYKTGTE